MSINNNLSIDKHDSIIDTLRDDLNKIAQATHHEPFNILGNQTKFHHEFILFYSPNTVELFITELQHPARRIADSDFFSYNSETAKLETPYLLTRTDQNNNVYSNYDPYSFKPQLKDYDLHLFSEGKHLHIYRILGSHAKTIEGVDGVLFATWAPNADVSVS